MLLVSARQPVLQQKALVAEAILDRRIIVNQVCRRRGDDDFDIATWNQLKSFSSSNIHQLAAGGELTQNIEAKFLL